ncbi:MAG: GNAT family N-acetyltransferase [Candidatus Hodarchaeota archaeon]
MKVIDLTDELKKLYFVCLEDWSEMMKEAGNHKEIWYNNMKNKGLGVKLAVDDNGEIGGMIQYIPIEYSVAEGNDLYFIPCIWIHNYQEGRGNFTGKGLGTALLEAAEADVKSKGAKGMVAWGLTTNFWMMGSWFEKHGYSIVDKQEIQALLWKPFYDDAIPPKWINQKKTPETIPGKVVVTTLINGWCPAQNRIFEIAKKAASEFGDMVIFREINTSDRDIFLEWGMADALFIDEKKMRTGPIPFHHPSAYELIKKAIAEKVKKL